VALSEALGEAFIAIRGDLTTLNKDLDKARKTTDDAVGKIGDSAKTLGKGLTVGLTAPILAIGAAVTTAGFQFSEGLKTIRAETGATGHALEELGKDFRAVWAGGEQSAEVVSKALADLNQRTGAHGTTLQVLTRQYLDFSSVLETDVNPLVEEGSKMFTQWGIAAEEQALKLDHLLKVVQATGVPIDSLLGGMGRFGPLLREMGFSFEEASVLFGQWNKAGIAGERGMMALNTAALKFSKDGVGLREGLSVIIAEIQKLGPGSASAILAMSAFGKNGLLMRDAILSGAFSIDKLVGSIAASTETIGKADTAADSLADKFLSLKNNVMASLAPIGVQLVDAFERMLPAILPVLNILGKAAEVFAAMPVPVQMAVFAFGALLAAIGPVIYIIGTLISSVVAMAPAVTLVKSGMVAMGLATTGVTAGFWSLMAVLGPVTIAIGALLAAWKIGQMETVKNKIAEWTLRLGGMNAEQAKAAVAATAAGIAASKQGEAVKHAGTVAVAAHGGVTKATGALMTASDKLTEAQKKGIIAQISGNDKKKEGADAALAAARAVDTLRHAEDDLARSQGMQTSRTIDPRLAADKDYRAQRNAEGLAMLKEDAARLDAEEAKYRAYLNEKYEEEIRQTGRAQDAAKLIEEDMDAWRRHQSNMAGEAEIEAERVRLLKKKGLWSKSAFEIGGIVKGIFETFGSAISGMITNLISSISSKLTGWLGKFMPGWAAQMVGGLTTSLLGGLTQSLTKTIGGKLFGNLLGGGGPGGGLLGGLFKGGGLLGKLGGMFGGGGAAGGVGGVGGAAGGAGGMMGSLGPLLTNPITGIVAGGLALGYGIIKKGLFRGGEEHMKVNKPREQFITGLGTGEAGGTKEGAWNQLNERLFAITGNTNLMQALAKADTEKDFLAAKEAILEKLESAKAVAGTAEGTAAGVTASTEMTTFLRENVEVNRELLAAVRRTETEGSSIRDLTIAPVFNGTLANEMRAFLRDELLPLTIQVLRDHGGLRKDLAGVVEQELVTA
jgi:phage-related minor tail protein